MLGGDDYSAFRPFGQLLECPIELGWVRGSEREPSEAEFYSFVLEHRQAEVYRSRSPVPINSVFAFCNQSGIRFRRISYNVSLMVFRNQLGLHLILQVCRFQVFQWTALVVRGAPESNPILRCLSMELHSTMRK